MLLVLILALAVSAALGGCDWRQGTASSTSTWDENADRVLASFRSSLGTAEIVLKARLEGRLPDAVAVVAVRDAVEYGDKASREFLVASPPRERRQADQEVSRACRTALGVLHVAYGAVVEGRRAAWSTALRTARTELHRISTVRHVIRGGGE